MIAVRVISLLRGIVCVVIVGQLAGCISFTKHPTLYQQDWGSLRDTTSCSELTGRYGNAGVLAVQPDWKKTPFLSPVELGNTLAHLIGRSTPEFINEVIQYVELNVPEGGAGIEVGIQYSGHMERFLMPWSDRLQCVNGVVRMGRRYEDAGDLPGRSFNKEVLTFARTSRDGLVIKDEGSSLFGGAFLFIVAAGGEHHNSWYGWPAYGGTPFPVNGQ